jgi:hypothetical protein
MFGSLSVRLFVVFSLLIGGLAACGPTPVTQTNQTARFQVTMTIDATKMGTRTIDLTITDRSGNPATVDQVLVAPVMREMGMASPEMVATSLGGGRYTLRGEPFSMIGIWQLDLLISADGQEDATTFTIEIT